MISDTKNKIDKVFRQALEIFRKKMNNYGPSWIGFSYLGFADQIYIKAYRYKTLIHSKDRKIPDPPELELYAIINYCILFLIARDRGVISHIFNSPTAMFEPPSPNAQEKLLRAYKREIDTTIELKDLGDAL